MTRLPSVCSSSQALSKPTVPDAQIGVPEPSYTTRLPSSCMMARPGLVPYVWVCHSGTAS